MVYLSDSEIREICRPLKQPAAQCRFLERLGFKVERRPDGTPLVLIHALPAHEPGKGPIWSR